MSNSVFIARIFGLCYLIIGAGFVLNRKAFVRVMEDFCKNAAMLFYGAILSLVIGIVIILTHNLWVADWRVIITIIGWLGLAKGIWMIAFPDSVSRFMEAYLKDKKLLAVHSMVALIFGAFLTFFGFFA
ncbi:hypothetical protein ACFL1K_02750 [Candidatus Omnitrophota bacterium]